MSRSALVGLGFASLVGVLPAQEAPLPAPPRPVVASNGQFDVVLVTAPAAAALGDGDALARYLAACGRTLLIPEGDSVAVSSGRSWDWTAAAASGPGRVTLLLSRTIAAEVDCAAPSTDRRLAFGRGLRVTRDTALRAPRRILRAELYRGDALVEPMERESMLSTSVSRHGLLLEEGGIVRVVVPVDALRPDSSGRITDIRLAITGADTVYVHSMRLREESLLEVWDQLLAPRAALAGAETAAAAARLAVARPPAFPPAAGPADAEEVERWVDLGIAFADADDDAAARIAFRAALAREPCATLGPSVSDETRTLFTQTMRPAARCHASVRLTALRSVLLPGFGQYAGTRRKVIGGLVLGVVASAMIASQSANDEARALYAAYLEVEHSDPASAAILTRRAYDRAEDRRLLGSRLVILSTTVWATSIAEAVWRERRLAQRLDRVRGIEPSRPRVGLEALLAPRSVGLAVAIR